MISNEVTCVVMSVDDGKNVVMKGVTHGACDYLIKPVRIEALKNIWQHVVRKRKNEWKDVEQSGVDDIDRQQKTNEDADYSSSANEGSWRNSKRRKDDEDADERDDSSTLKKPRVVWSVELHQQFVAAVNQLGIDSMNFLSSFSRTSLFHICICMPVDKIVKLCASTFVKLPLNFSLSSSMIVDLLSLNICFSNFFSKLCYAFSDLCEMQSMTTEAVPKKILELMNVPGLTRENVASHLQVRTDR